MLSEAMSTIKHRYLGETPSGFGGRRSTQPPDYRKIGSVSLDTKHPGGQQKTINKKST
jgi:hypothetical protein